MMEEQIKSILSQYMDELWLNGRHKVREIQYQLDGFLLSLETDTGKHLNASNEDRELVLDWLRFFEFLQDHCSGHLFTSDKQWNELMARMEISRKLNHRSVKLKDLIRNKQLIQANESSIRQLNQSIKLAQSIDQSLTELEQNIHACRLNCTNLNDNDDDDSRDKSLLEDLLNSSDHLQNLCQPLILTLKLELENELLLGCGGALIKQADSWRARINVDEGLINQMSQFVETFLQLQANFIQLRPLFNSVIQASNARDMPTTKVHNLDKNSQINSRECNLSNSLEACKTNFRQILQFRRQLIESLRSPAQGLNCHGRPSVSKQSVGSSSRLGSDKASRQTNSFSYVQLSKFVSSEAFKNQQLMQKKLQDATEKSNKCCELIHQVSNSLRLEFGHFYFVSELELLTIIALDTRLISEAHLVENRRLISKLFNNSIDGFQLKSSMKKSAKEEELNHGSRGMLSSHLVKANTTDPTVCSIIGVKTPIGELIPLIDESPIPLKKRVNIYSVEIVRILNEVLRKLRRSLQKLLKQHLELRQSNWNEPLQIGWQLPIQLMILSEHVEFTRRVESILLDCPADDGKSLGSNENQCTQFEQLLQIYENQYKQLASGNNFLAPSGQVDGHQLDHLKRSAALSTTVHFMSCLMRLRETCGVSSLFGNDWNWQKLPRYYVMDTDPSDVRAEPQKWRLEVRLGKAKFNYKFDCLPIQLELGPQPVYKRLISTLTSEKCFLVASQAISRLKLGASPFGPAGSGKTETIKALGQLLGCQVIVHNCDESNDFETLDRLIWGLAHTGLWGCFDEFNRLSVSTLSGVSATLELIQSSLRQGKQTIELATSSAPNYKELKSEQSSSFGLDSIKNLDPASAFFITMNPGDGQKYRGRRQLPANLRSLFLSISMVDVQIDAIVGEMLLSFAGQLGLNTLGRPTNDCSESLIDCLDTKTSIRLASSLANWMNWMQTNDIISNSSRCVLDLRLVMSVLRRFKKFLLEQKWLVVNDDNKVSSAENKIRILLAQATRCELEPRLSGSELAQLELGLSENFALESIGKLRKNLIATDLAKNLSILQCDNSAIRAFVEEKVELLSSQLRNRTGVLLVGPTGAGKSLTWREYCNSFTNNIGGNQVVRWFAFNPKCCSNVDLFGHVDPIDAKWIDGRLTSLVRESLELLAQPQSPLEQVLIVLDGPIDPDWIECLNSVLDDNQVLTLGSGERLSFTLNGGRCIKLIFETTDIQFASPATISRLGLLYYEQTLIESINFYGEEAASNKMRLVVGGLDLTRAARNNLELLKWKCNTNILQPNLSHSLTDLRVLENFLIAENNPARLLILVGSSGRFAESFGACKQNILEFNCCKYSNSRHLIEILQHFNGKRDILLIKNLHLIEPEDSWGTRTFVELLQFTITYCFYYDFERQTERRIGNKQRFVLKFDELSQLSDATRLLSLGVIHLADVSKQMDCRLNIDLNHLSSHLNDTGTILTLCNVHSSIKGKHSIIDAMKHIETTHKLVQFNNQTQITVAIEVLAKLLRQKTNSTMVKMLFVLHQMELQMMDSHLAGELYQLLNFLKLQTTSSSSSMIKFVHLVEDKFEDFAMNTNYSRFWASIGRVSELKDSHDFASISRDTIEKQLMDQFNIMKLSKSILFNDNENLLSWLVAKIEHLFLNGSQINKQLKGDNFEDGKLIAKRPEQLDEFLVIFLKLVDKHWTSLTSLKRILSNGLDCLMQFEQSVERIKLRCIEEEQKLAKIKLNVEQLMVEISSKLRDGEKQRNQVIQLKELQSTKSQEVARQSEQIEKQLQQVRPQIESSKMEISRCLKPEALNEIKTLRAPPKTIKDILDVLFIFLGIQDLSWASIKVQLTKSTLRDELLNYDFKSRLDATLVNKLKLEMRQRQSSLSLEQATRASAAIVPILKWIQAAFRFGEVLVELGPLTSQLDQLQAEFRDLKQRMQRLELEKSSIDEIITIDQERLEELRKSYASAQLECIEMRSNLDKAQKVRQDLGKQMDRWQSKLRFASASHERKSLLMTCLIAAGLASNFDTNFELNLNGWWSYLDGSKEAVAIHSESPTVTQSETSRLIKLINLVDDELDEHNDLLLAEEEFRASDATNTNLSERQLLQLSIMKICLSPSCSQLIPFIRISNRSQLLQEQLINCLSLKGILCSKDEAQLIQVSNLACGDNNLNSRSNYSSSNWRQSIEIALKLNKLIIIPMTHTPLDLDIIDLTMGAHCSNQVENRSRRIILIGQWELLEKSLRALMRPFNLIAIGQVNFYHTNDEKKTNGCNETIMGTLMDLLIQCSDPTLSQTTRQVEQAIKCKQREAKAMELQLLRRLMMSNGGIEQQIIDSSFRPMSKDENLDNHQELIKVLSELQLVNENLAKSMGHLEGKLLEFRRKADKFKQLAQQAAHFYQTTLAQFYANGDVFCRLSLKRFAELIYGLSNEHITCQQQSNRARVGEDPNELLICHAMLAMRPEMRHQFGLKLLAEPTSGFGFSPTGYGLTGGANEWPTWSKANIQAAMRRAASLEQTIVALLSSWLHQLCSQQQLVRQNEAQMLSHGVRHKFTKLMVVQHDAKRSSPQLELDELFSGRKMANLSHEVTQKCSTISSLLIDYRKIYATTTTGLSDASAAPLSNKFVHDLPSTFETKLIKILMSPYQSSSRTGASSCNRSLASVTDNFNNNNNEISNLDISSNSNITTDRRSPTSSLTNHGRQLKLRVVCIANAHLVSQWLNGNLIGLIGGWQESASRGSINASASDELLLVILVGEYQLQSLHHERPEQILEETFDANLLDESDVKYWHDTATLQLADRFQLYSKSLLASQLICCLRDHESIRLLEGTTNGSGGAREELHELINGIILLHVVCQELNEIQPLASWATLGPTTTSNNHKPQCSSVAACGEHSSGGCRWQLAGQYNFDLDQLCLAFTLVEQILNDLLESHREASSNGKKPATHRLPGQNPEAIIGDLAPAVAGPRFQCSQTAASNLEKQMVVQQRLILSSFWQIRRPVCQQLEWIVYGPRLECSADERRLKQLIGSLLGNREITQRQLENLEQLANLSADKSCHGLEASQLIEYQRLLLQLTAGS